MFIKKTNNDSGNASVITIYGGWSWERCHNHCSAGLLGTSWGFDESGSHGCRRPEEFNHRRRCYYLAASDVRCQNMTFQ